MYSTPKFGLGLASASLLLAVLAYLPGATVYTPALIVSLGALIGGVVGIYLGAIRTGGVAVLVVAATFAASPLSPLASWFSSIKPIVWVSGTALTVLVVSGLLLANYRNRRSRQ